MVSTSPKAIETLKITINSLREEKRSYQYIADIFGVNKGIIWAIINDGYIPKSDEIKKKLGLDTEPEIIIVKRHRDKLGRFR